MPPLSALTNRCLISEVYFLHHTGWEGNVYIQGLYGRLQILLCSALFWMHVASFKQLLILGK
jgi:hypothetical protein